MLQFNQLIHCAKIIVRLIANFGNVFVKFSYVLCFIYIFYFYLNVFAKSDVTGCGFILNSSTSGNFWITLYVCAAGLPVWNYMLMNLRQLDLSYSRFTQSHTTHSVAEHFFYLAS